MFWRRRKPKLIEPGEWDESDGKPRVLVENPDRLALWAYADLLREHGYHVATCTGEEHDGSTRCPLLESGRCGLVEGADVVFSTCSLAESDAMLAMLAAKDSPPVVFEAPRLEFDRYQELAPDSKLIPLPVHESAFLAAIAKARAETPADPSQ